MNFGRAGVALAGIRANQQKLNKYELEFNQDDHDIEMAEREMASAEKVMSIH